MPQITITGTPHQIAAIAKLVATLDHETPTAPQQDAGNRPHSAAEPRSDTVDTSLGAKALWDLWEAHPATIQARARSWGWGALTPQEKGQIAVAAYDRIVDRAVAGIRDLIKMWAGSAMATTTVTKNESEPHGASGPRGGPYDVACPVCGSQPGGWCTELGGREIRPAHDRRSNVAAGCICHRNEDEPGYGLLCPVHGDPIGRKNVGERAERKLLGHETVPYLTPEGEAELSKRLTEHYQAQADEHREASISRSLGGINFPTSAVFDEAFRIAQGNPVRDTPEEAVQKMRDHAATAADELELCGYASPLVNGLRSYECTKPAGHQASYEPDEDGKSDPDALNHRHPDTSMAWRTELKPCAPVPYPSFTES